MAARFQKREAGLSWLRVLKKSSNKNACECAVHRHPGKGIYTQIILDNSRIDVLELVRL